MADHDKVKRGFAFYLFMLVLIVFAAFLVWVMILLFTPNKSILGIVYFNYNQPKVLTQTTDNEASIDFDAIDQIVVNSSYANVLVTKSSDVDSKDCVKVTNNAKGFAKASDYTDFEYSVSLDGRVLTISVKEPTGFLYFSRDISINICLSNANTKNFKNTEFVINTQSGNVTIGNANDTELPLPLEIADLSVTTSSGNITLTNQNGKDDVMPFETLMLSTSYGTIKAEKKISCVMNAKLSVAKNGRITLGDFVSQNGLSLVLNNGRFSAKQISADVSVAQLVSGRVDIEEIVGTTDSSFDTNESENIDRATIKIGKLGCVSIPFGNKANIIIGQLLKSGLIRTTSGNVDLNDTFCTDLDVKTVSGNINLVVGDLYNQGYTRNLESSTGNIKIRFVFSVYNFNNVKTKGNFELAIPSGAEFTLDLNNYNGEPIKKLGSRVKINFVDDETYEKEHPLKVNYQEGDILSFFESRKVRADVGGRILVYHDLNTSLA